MLLSSSQSVGRQEIIRRVCATFVDEKYRPTSYETAETELSAEGQVSGALRKLVEEGLIHRTGQTGHYSIREASSLWVNCNLNRQRLRAKSRA